MTIYEAWITGHRWVSWNDKVCKISISNCETKFLLINKAFVHSVPMNEECKTIKQFWHIK